MTNRKLAQVVAADFAELRLIQASGGATASVSDVGLNRRE